MTIFVSTHFMNEASRCDRISLMNAGRVLATETPAALIRQQGARTLEEAFISYLEEEAGSRSCDATRRRIAAGEIRGSAQSDAPPAEFVQSVQGLRLCQARSA